MPETINIMLTLSKKLAEDAHVPAKAPALERVLGQMALEQVKTLTPQ